MTFSCPDLESAVVNGVRVWQATPRDPVGAIVAIAGPPTSSLLFRHLAAPLGAAGYALSLPEPFDPAPVGRADVASLAERLAPVVPDGATLVVHGLALPLGFELLRRTKAVGLVVLDGPLDGLDPVSRTLAGAAAAAPRLVRALLHPAIAVPWLASSLALRRTVVNPYAMDRDIVAMLAAPIVATPERRRAVADYLRSIRRIGPPWSGAGKRVLALWSSSDLLYPLPVDMSRSVVDAEVSAISLAGARFLSVEERPWEVARSVIRWVREGASDPHRDTDVAISRSEPGTGRGTEQKKRRTKRSTRPSTGPGTPRA